MTVGQRYCPTKKADLEGLLLCPHQNYSFAIYSGAKFLSTALRSSKYNQINPGVRPRTDYSFIFGSPTLVFCHLQNFSVECSSAIDLIADLVVIFCSASNVT